MVKVVKRGRGRPAKATLVPENNNKTKKLPGKVVPKKSGRRPISAEKNPVKVKAQKVVHKKHNNSSMGHKVKTSKAPGMLERKVKTVAKKGEAITKHKNTGKMSMLRSKKPVPTKAKVKEVKRNTGPKVNHLHAPAKLASKVKSRGRVAK